MSASPRALLQRAIACHQRGDLADAASLYRDVLAAQPEHFDALHLLGVLETQRGDHQQAVALIRRAIAIERGQAAAHSNLALALQRQGLLSDALASFDESLRIRPAHPGSLYNRGNVLLGIGQPQEALDSYDRALALDAGNGDAWFHRGNALVSLERLGEAVASYDRAIGIRPDFVEALNNRGLVLMQLGHHQHALASYDRALAVKPDAIQPLNNRANACQALQRFAEASQSLAQLVAVAPGYEYARGRLLECRLHCADWSPADDDANSLRHAVEAGERAVAPFAFLAMSDSAPAQLQCARIFAADKFPAGKTPLWKGERYRHDRIRVAYLSADFRDHPLTHLLAGIFERHDRRQLETIAVSFGGDDDSATRSRLKQAFDRFIDVGERNDRDVAALLRSMEIDIAVDLMGFTAGSRTGVLAWRPAPIQVNYLGFPGTMGADYIDYIIADRFLIPEARRSCYAEQVVYLPDTFQANGATRDAATPRTRSELGLPPAGFVFCSFNTTYKITPQMFDRWMRLLQQCQGSVLWLLGGEESVRATLRSEAALRHVDPGRLVFASRVPYAEHLARYALADLFLDTLPFNGGATASDALWAGLPVLTCSGDAFAARMAGSLLNAVGLPDLITASPDEYEALALKLAADREHLGEIKQRLARNRAGCPLFDSDRFRRHLEAAYRTMWERYRREDHPEGFAVG